MEAMEETTSVTLPRTKVFTGIIKDLRLDYRQLSGRPLNVVINVIMRGRKRQIIQLKGCLVTMQAEPGIMAPPAKKCWWPQEPQKAEV